MSATLPARGARAAKKVHSFVQLRVEHAIFPCPKARLEFEPPLSLAKIIAICAIKYQTWEKKRFTQK
jgi:hypothetical protein